MKFGVYFEIKNKFLIVDGKDVYDLREAYRIFYNKNISKLYLYFKAFSDRHHSEIVHVSTEDFKIILEEYISTKKEEEI